MKLLLDENLSWRLVKLLKEAFSEVIHVKETGLKKPATDAEIWKYAKSNDFVILTNDEDFDLILQQRGFPPKIILLKTGNSSTQNIADKIKTSREEIEAFAKSEEYGLLEIY
jgi:predicted nuclease of predicted toxin-antitoxin system